MDGPLYLSSKYALDDLHGRLAESLRIFYLYRLDRWDTVSEAIYLLDSVTYTSSMGINPGMSPTTL